MITTTSKKQTLEQLQERVEKNLAEGGDYGFGKVAAFRKSIDLVNEMEKGASKAFVEEIASLAFNGKVDEEQLQDIINAEFSDEL